MSSELKEKPRSCQAFLLAIFLVDGVFFQRSEGHGQNGFKGSFASVFVVYLVFIELATLLCGRFYCASANEAITLCSLAHVFLKK